MPVADLPGRSPDGEAVLLPCEEPVRVFHSHVEEGAPEVGVGCFPKDPLKLAGRGAHVLGDVGQIQVELRVVLADSLLGRS